MKRTPLFFVLAAVFLLAACFTPSPAAKINAKSKLQPVVAAIDIFRAEVGRLPDSIEELQAKTAKKLLLSYSTDAGLVWSISYEKNGSNSYKAGFNHVHYTLIYTNGKETDWDFNPWR